MACANNVRIILRTIRYRFYRRQAEGSLRFKVGECVHRMYISSRTGFSMVRQRHANATLNYSNTHTRYATLPRDDVRRDETRRDETARDRMRRDETGRDEMRPNETR